MSLQFPNARLFIHDLISIERLSGPAAMVQAAYEFGLVPIGSSSGLACNNRGNGHCACFATAKDILTRHLTGQASSGQLAPVKIDEIWSSIERQADGYQKSSPGERSSSELCNRMAPTLFDLLLQEVRRYS
jgi:hypothetical protein